MNHLAYCTALYSLGYRYHSGQDSRGYRLLCIAAERVKREHSGIDLGRIVERLGLIGGSPDAIAAGDWIYPKGGKFRNLVAMYTNQLRKYRWQVL